MLQLHEYGLETQANRGRIRLKCAADLLTRVFGQRIINSCITKAFRMFQLPCLFGFFCVIFLFCHDKQQTKKAFFKDIFIYLCRCCTAVQDRI